MPYFTWFKYSTHLYYLHHWITIVSCAIVIRWVFAHYRRWYWCHIGGMAQILNSSLTTSDTRSMSWWGLAIVLGVIFRLNLFLLTRETKVLTTIDLKLPTKSFHICMWHEAHHSFCWDINKRHFYWKCFILVYKSPSFLNINYGYSSYFHTL